MDDTDLRTRSVGSSRPAGRAQRSRRVAFSTRIVLLTVATAVLTLVIAGSAIVATEPSQESLDEITQTLAPAGRHLERAGEASRKAQQAFVESITTTGADRQAAIGRSQRLGNVAATEWRAYQAVARERPGERRLIREYDAVTRASQEAGATAFALADAPDSPERASALDRQSMAAERASAIVRTIRTRYYLERISDNAATADRQIGDAQVALLLVAAIVLVAVATGGALLFREARRDERVLEADEQQRRDEARRAGLEMQLQRGLEMEPTEESTYDVLHAALQMVRPDDPTELLVAESALGRFARAVSVAAADPDSHCAVESPASCPAASRGQTRLFESSARLDACPHLRDRPTVPRAAACIPVNIAGAMTGVIHAVGPELQIPGSNQLAELELVARKAGERIGYLRVLARSEMQARVDALTGLVNRRSLDDHARALVERDEPFSVAFADLDHFKVLNDTFGHETGDRALRLFGRVLRDALRPADIAARYGGEEFVILLPGTALADARPVAERIRTRLEQAADGASVPPFTVSVGLAAWEPPEDFSDAISRADAAMLHAKAQGRDRIVASADVPEGPPLRSVEGEGASP